MNVKMYYYVLQAPITQMGLNWHNDHSQLNSIIPSKFIIV